MKKDYEIQREKDFKEAKQKIMFNLRGDNKYYYAMQCLQFETNLKRYGFDHVATKERICDEGLYFNKYSITLGHQYGYDLKNFSSKEEMLGFVIGYNEAINNLEYDNKIKGVS